MNPAACLVTGATGFVGAHIVRALLARGLFVRCLVRPESDRRNVEGLAVDLIEGDLRDRASLGRALRGCEWLFHCAADYRLGVRDPESMFRTNVEGTQNLLSEAVDAKVKRVVYTSSVGALGLTADGTPADEGTPVRLQDMIGHYKRSKFLAERAAEAMLGKGLPIVIVNPSTPVGELDRKPTPTGRIIVDYLNGRIPAYVDTGLNLVDVRDVAEGHLLAAERGRIGERYVLGCANLTLKQILDLLADITGRQKVRWRVPHALPWAAAALDETWSWVRGRLPRISLESVRMSRKKMFFDSGKAMRELGFPQSPVHRALERAARFFEAEGYVAAGGRAKKA